MSISPFKFKFKKEKNKEKSKFSSNSSNSVNNSNSNSNSDSSSFQEGNNFNQNFFNEENTTIKNDDFNTNTNTKYTSSIEPKNNNEKNLIKNYLSKNILYESKNISNIIEENNNNNSFINFSILKFLNNSFGFNNNNSNNNNNIIKNIHNFIIEKFSKPLKNWLIKSSSIKIKKKIGEGSSSDIFLGLYKGTQIAEKRLHLINTEKDVLSFKREVSSFILLQHPYLLFFFGVIAEPKQLSIITEYCPGGNLHELLLKKKNIFLSWNLRKKILLQIAIGMNFLHSNNPPILHRDLKSLNIFLTNDLKNSSDITDIKIGDFGLSILYEKKNFKNLAERVGTCHWMAPEVINSQKYTTKADVYSFGIIIWEVCTREKPYDCLSKENILFRVSVRKERPSLKRINNDTPKKLVELMQKCWEHDPNKRPSFKEIIQFIKNIDIEVEG